MQNITGIIMSKAKSKRWTQEEDDFILKNPTMYLDILCANLNRPEIQVIHHCLYRKYPINHKRTPAKQIPVGKIWDEKPKYPNWEKELDIIAENRKNNKYAGIN
jgi:hypothetical protein